MIKAKYVVTQDGSGSHLLPETIIDEFEKEFETKEEMWEYENRQDGHPFLTLRLVSQEEIV